MKNLLVAFIIMLVYGGLTSQNQPGLHIDQNHTVLFGKDTTATVGLNAVKLMWQPSKGALRAGVMKQSWDYNKLGNTSVAFGFDNQASGSYSFATGRGNIAESYAEFSIGQNSLVNVNASPNSFNPTDVLFEIGNGLTPGARSNAVTVLKNGEFTLSDLEGVGDRAVFADAAGTLKTATPPSYAIGDFAEGGVVYYVSPNGKHIKVMNIYYFGQKQWSDESGYLICANSQDDGASNTMCIINQPGHTTSAALLCHNYSYGGYDDWYLPSINEMIAINSNKSTIAPVIAAYGGTINLTINLNYWTSNKVPEFGPVFYNFSTNSQDIGLTTYVYYSIAVRSFYIQN